MMLLRAILRRASRGGSEAGFTIVELMVAALVLSVGLVGVMGTIDVAGKAALSAQRHEQAVSIAQREVERLEALSFSELALSTAPTHEPEGNPPGDTSNNPTNPRYYVNTTAPRFLIMASYHDKNSGPVAGVSASGEELVTGGTVNAGPEDFSSGGATGRIHRFITWRDEDCSGDRCPGTHDSKRITVAVVLDRAANGAGPAKPVYVSSVVTDPDAGAPGSQAPPDPNAGNEPSAQSFFLTDTACSAAARQPLAGSHETHDTAQTGANCTAGPHFDLMPPDPGALEGGALPDYSTDVARTAPSGLALTRQDPGCPTSYASGEATQRRTSIHTWASPAFAGAFSTPSSGARSTLSVWSRTAGGTQGAATLCLTLRQVASNGTITLLGSGNYHLDEWPTEPAPLAFSVEHSPFTVSAGSRLLLTLSVQSASTTDVELLYDHPAYQSFVSVLTTTPIG